MDAQFDLEGHRREGEVVSSLEALGEVAVAALLEVKPLQQSGEHEEQQVHRELLAGARPRP